MRVFRAALALAGVCAGLAGCALPGYDTGGIDGQSWYDFGGSNSATYQDELNQNEIEYEPRLIKITPQLVARQREQRAEQDLSQSAQRVTAQSRTTVYTLGPGDVLQVVVFGHPELTNPTQSARGGDNQGQLINAAGEIYFPYVGEIHAAGKTASQLRSMIARRIASYIREPQVDVRVLRYRSKRVFISGDIAKPCTVPITDVTLNLLQALDACPALAGSSASSTGVNSSSGTSVGVKDVVLVRNGQTTRLNLNQIFSAGRSVPLESGDHLLIDDSTNRVFMYGEFSKQLALPYSSGGMSLDDAIADAGGVNLETADTGSIYVIRNLADQAGTVDNSGHSILRPTVYKLNASSPIGLMLANRFQLQPRDVVFAAPASLVNFNRAFALIAPELDTLFRSFLIYDRASGS